MPRELHLSAALDGAGHHPAAAQAFRTDPADLRTAAYWTTLVRLAEDGALDFVTLDDSLEPPPQDSGGRLDATAVLARVAPETSRIGLVPTVTTTHTEPFHVSSAIATLDFVSEGRAGWLVDVSTTAAEARAIGRRDPAPATRLWAEAGDAVEVAARLWDSWEDDAEIRDVATGRFIDRDRLHHIDFTGPHFTVRGPSIVPRPPQGRPPVAVVLSADDAEERWTLATRHADIVLLSARDPDTAGALREAVLRRTADAGRDPGLVRVLIRIAVTLADTRSAALDSQAPPADPGTVAYCGSPSGLADLLADWRAATSADGFHLLPSVHAADLPGIVHGLVPELRQRGLFRARYTCATLRDHLGLPRPASRYAREDLR